MTPETIFSVCSTGVLAGWLALLVGLQKPWGVTAARWVAVVLAVVYVAVLGLHFGEAEGGFGSLAEVMRLFDDKWVTTGGWIHYLCFDLFVGAWIVEQGREAGLKWWRVVPALPLTFLFGPSGLLVFGVLRGRAF
jgi:hypothetical protein